MPKRSLALPIVTLLAALTLAAGACGGDDDAEETTTPEAANEATPTAQPIPLAAATTEATSVPVLAEEALTTAEAVKILAPSVVQIVTEVLTMGFFNQPTPDRGVGTGVILDEEGHILTNNHVIAGAQNITVTLFDGESYPATVIGEDLSTDLAVIKIDAEGLRPATLGDSSQLEVGQDVIAIDRGHDHRPDSDGYVYKSWQQRRPSGECQRGDRRHQHGRYQRGAGYRIRHQH